MHKNPFLDDTSSFQPRLSKNGNVIKVKTSAYHAVKSPHGPKTGGPILPGFLGVKTPNAMTSNINKSKYNLPMPVVGFHQRTARGGVLLVGKQPSGRPKKSDIRTIVFHGFIILISKIIAQKKTFFTKSNQWCILYTPMCFFCCPSNEVPPMTQPDSNCIFSDLKVEQKHPPATMRGAV